MGGDFGPRVVVSGALQFLQLSEFEDSEIVFVGPEDVLREVLVEFGNPNGRVTVSHAPDVITMDDPPTDGVRRKESSLVVAHRLMKDGKVDAVVSAGNTGAVMASAIFNLGRIEGVSRPAIATLFPTTGDEPCLVIDVGANSDCKPDNLLEFAYMGSVYFEHVKGVSEPRVALLSIGEEKSKGNEVTIAVHRRLLESSLNFIGNVEGRDVLAGRSDVIVCDGFVGNVLLKFAESFQGFLYTKINRQVSTNIFSRLGAGLMAPFLRRMKRTFDYSQSGGAPLLGTNGVTIICHGSSNEMAVMNGIKMARAMVFNRVNDHIIEQLSTRYASTNIKGTGK